MKLKKSFFTILTYIFVYLIFSAHSPWGQYLAYREQHLLIMSVRVDAPTYPFSKILVEAINKELPEARARDFRRVQSLFSTNQMPLVLLSKKNANHMVKGSGPFKAYGSADAKVIYYFGDMILLAQPSFPDKFAWLITKALMNIENDLSGAKSPLNIKSKIETHPGTTMALNNEKMPELVN